MNRLKNNNNNKTFASFIIGYSLESSITFLQTILASMILLYMRNEIVDAKKLTISRRNIAECCHRNNAQTIRNVSVHFTDMLLWF